MTAARHTFDTRDRPELHRPGRRRPWSRTPPTGRSWPWPPTPPTTRPSSSAASARPTTRPCSTTPATPCSTGPSRASTRPGSTFKLITATAGLQYGLITPNTPFDDTGSITIGNFVAHNDNGAAYGVITLPTAITVSSDNFFNTIGLNLWYGRSTSTATTPCRTWPRSTASARPTGIALPNEAAGQDPDAGSPTSRTTSKIPSVFTQAQWYPGNSDQVAIGQDEVLVTPLQLANAYATFANGGNLLRPAAGPRRRRPGQRPRRADLPTPRCVHTISAPARLAAGHARRASPGSSTTRSGRPTASSPAPRWPPWTSPARPGRPR